ncbi:hypothetical protein EJP77_10365 [Paenibacillus zeisoli]|uniref:Uncharacterized protein n=1 Tax=Paenibacillus zeisoli TaxID=2496267 RepID=A0A433XCA3_9BACL|nr:hypothetical protein [Paenibacillus zeisoli]RUT31781.1 hypothetical protein EJP77_10365 [Paenibacillus zeisoli]
MSRLPSPLETRFRLEQRAQEAPPGLISPGSSWPSAGVTATACLEALSLRDSLTSGAWLGLLGLPLPRRRGGVGRVAFDCLLGGAVPAGCAYLGCMAWVTWPASTSSAGRSWAGLPATACLVALSLRDALTLSA